MREAVLHPSDDRLAEIGIDEVVSAAREAGRRDATELACHGSGGIVLFGVIEPVPEDEFDDFESVVWWSRLASSRDGVRSTCEVDAPGLPDDFAPDTLGVAREVSEVRPDGVELSVIGPQAGIGRGVTEAADAGMELSLEPLAKFRGDGPYTAP